MVSVLFGRSSKSPGLYAGILLTISVGLPAVQGHHPERIRDASRQPVDLIGPVGNRLPPGHRRKYNRPSKIGGWFAYQLAPTSQEAMAYHRASHKGYYNGKHPRMETHYFYPKPYEVIAIGARRQREKLSQEEPAVTFEGPELNPIPDVDPSSVEPLIDGDSLELDQEAVEQIPAVESIEASSRRESQQSEWFARQLRLESPAAF